MDKIQADTAKNQHYVPRFLLKNFSYGSKQRIYAFDKLRGIKISTNVKNSACENGFYNLIIDGEKHTLEHKLSKLETIAGAIINKICKDESLENITEEEHMDLCLFLSNLLLRVKRQREWLSQLNSNLAGWLQKMGLDPNQVQNFEVLEKDEIGKQHIQITLANTLEFAETLCAKQIFLLKAPSGSNFIIGDNPVVMYNRWHKKFGADTGISVPGIEIQVPLSNKLCLSLMCPILILDLSEKIEKLALWRHKNLDVPDTDILYTKKLVASISTRKAIEVEKSNVTFSNSLQINQSLNYIYSCKDDFNLIIEMINAYPHLSSGKLFSQNFM